MLITELVDLLDAPVIRVIKDCSSVDAQLMGSTMLVQANILGLITQLLEFVTCCVTLLGQSNAQPSFQGSAEGLSV